MLIMVTCLILSVCRGNLAFKCHWILSKLMKVATFIYSLRQEWTFLWNYQIIGPSRWYMQHVSYRVWLWELQPHFRIYRMQLHFFTTFRKTIHYLPSVVWMILSWPLNSDLFLKCGGQNKEALVDITPIASAILIFKQTVFSFEDDKSLLIETSS